MRAVFAAAPAAAWPVKAIADIRQARAALARLDKLEAAAAAGPGGGKPLTAAEALARRTELDTRGGIQERLDALCAEAKMWFETSAEFEERVLEGIRGLGGSMRGAKGGR